VYALQRCYGVGFFLDDARCFGLEDFVQKNGVGGLGCKMDAGVFFALLILY
jgi:hypothetical protein